MRIRMLSILVSIMLVLAFASAASAENGASMITAGTIVVVNNPDSSDRLNLRTEPSQSAPTLGKYYNGTYPEALSDEKDGWVKVRIFGLEGYMMTEYLVYPDQLQAGAATVPTVKIRNSGGSGLNLRKAQSTNSSSLGLYQNGSTVRVFGVSETWCHVQTEDGNVGFMLRERLSPVPEYQKSGNANTHTNTGSSQPGGSSAVVDNPNSIDRLNLRTEPSQSAPTLGKYYSGTTVEVLGGDQNGWTKVRIDTLEGYMMTKYLVFGQDQYTVGYAIPSVKIENAVGTGLNLRRGQSTGSPSLGLYPNGSTVRVYGVGETWCHVQTEDGNVGFMLRESLSPAPKFERGDPTGDELEGSWFYEPFDRTDPDDFIPSGNG
ncbi:MAG: SH3 domain-containing protein [Clostridia bacterium]|nr:SH3 domain-containing protein [Clostridia bacterium]